MTVLDRITGIKVRLSDKGELTKTDKAVLIEVCLCKEESGFETLVLWVPLKLYERVNEHIAIIRCAAWYKLPHTKYWLDKIF